MSTTKRPKCTISTILWKHLVKNKISSGISFLYRYCAPCIRPKLLDLWSLFCVILGDLKPKANFATSCGSSFGRSGSLTRDFHNVRSTEKSSGVESLITEPDLQKGQHPQGKETITAPGFCDCMDRTKCVSFTL